MKKKLLALALAAVLTLNMGVVAMAAGDTQSVNGTGDQGGDIQLEAAVLQGADLIQVVMPTKINFNINTDSSTYFDELISGRGTITNNSTKAVKVEIVGVQDSGVSTLLTKAKIALAPSDNAYVNDSMTNKEKGEAVLAGSSPSYKLTTSVSPTASITLFDSLPTRASKSIEVFGTEETATTAIDAASYTVVTTLKISIAS
ncbi:hypothetical protein [Anaerolentibacter hominis]|uniref:hypothetical protein n=1 Tax=Anaerolentibacter hominis TaxID=3079009 RepID=UPI0031B7FC5C